jgi:hypothetical protein
MWHVGCCISMTLRKLCTEISSLYVSNSLDIPTVSLSLQTNILVDKRRVAVLADFGVAKILEIPGTTTVRGTPDFMAPERLHFNPCPPTKMSDVYSFALVVVLVCTDINITSSVAQTKKQ